MFIWMIMLLFIPVTKNYNRSLFKLVFISNLKYVDAIIYLHLIGWNLLHKKKPKPEEHLFYCLKVDSHDFSAGMDSLFEGKSALPSFFVRVSVLAGRAGVGGGEREGERDWKR